MPLRFYCVHMPVFLCSNCVHCGVFRGISGRLWVTRKMRGYNTYKIKTACNSTLQAVFCEKAKRKSTAFAVLFLARKEGFEASFFVAALRFPAFLCRNCVNVSKLDTLNQGEVRFRF